MKKLLFYTSLCLTVLSCARVQDEPLGYALLSVSADLLETKAVSSELMTVTIEGEGFSAKYKYSQLPEYIKVPVDRDIPYVISAENVSESQAELLPDIWGQIRYAGQTELLIDKIHDPDSETKNYYVAHVECSVSNTLVSVTFDENIKRYYTDYKVVVYTDENRKLEFTPSNVATAVAHFTPGKDLHYEFSGNYTLDAGENTLTGTATLVPADHLVFNFKMKNAQGAVGGMVIDVNTTCENLYEDVIVDPSEDGYIQ